MYELITSKFSKKFWGILLSLLLAVGMLGYGFGTNSAYGASVDVGANPKPPVDIAVNVPADYPGTFLDFKKELTEKLLAQGMPEGSFRITTTKVDIDTTNLNGWYIYDHYAKDIYESVKTTDDKTMQPDQTVDDASDPIVPIENYFKNGKKPTAVQKFSHHIYSYEAGGMSNMAFAGYYTNAYTDFMFYPATSSSTRTFEFDLDTSVLNKHTLTGGGFLMNCGIIGGKLYGYELYYTDLVRIDANSDSPAKPTKVEIRQINGVTPTTNDTNATGSALSKSTKSVNLGTELKAHITVELKRDSITVQQQNYLPNGNLNPEITTVYKDFPIPQFVDGETLNGFGPIVDYSHHNCSGLSMFIFTNLAMSYEVSAFDALQNVQYYQGEENKQKYFINLTGSNSDPGIPEPGNKNYKDGINRMNSEGIFYISNTDDGYIVRDSNVDESGNVTQLGLGSENGFIATGEDYTSEIAEYIYTGYTQNRTFKHQDNIGTEMPMANFYVQNMSTGDQLMTIHIQHLLNAEKYNTTHEGTEGFEPRETTVPVNIKDSSKPGTVAPAGDKLTGWRLKIYDPSNKVVSDSGWKNSASEIPNYAFTKDSTPGRWGFELTVRDNAGVESKAFQTYAVAFLDNAIPEITGANSSRNTATITLTDTGSGIDEDGITFIEDGRGSGVAAYYVTDNKENKPLEKDWIKLDKPEHTYSFDVDLAENGTKPIVIWTRDECGNEGAYQVFQPKHVIVKDPTGEPIDEYYVIGEKPIVVLPDEEDIPNKPEDENEKFSGWEIEDGGDDPNPITPGTSTPDGDDNTIVIKPTYSKDYSTLVFKTDGGQFSDGSVIKEKKVVENSAIIKGVEAFDKENPNPTKTGYTFVGWKYIKNGNVDNSNNPDYIKNNAENVAGQIASRTLNEQGEVLNDRHYLVAQWEIGKYKLTADANGGTLNSNFRSVDNIPFGTNLKTMKDSSGFSIIPTSGVKIPTRPGYIFQGWSTVKSAAGDTSNVFMAGASGIKEVNPPVMDGDKTIYAVWKQDTNRFIVSFDSNGGSSVSDQSYLKNPSEGKETNYSTFKTPTRAGYTFTGWYPKGENGKPSGDQPYVGQEKIIKRENHEFIATWKPNPKQTYYVDYYYNTGNKDASGNFIYLPSSATADSKRVALTGSTEDSVVVPKELIQDTVTINGVEYWYNSAASSNLLSGVITGNPQLTLRLCYDRYFKIDAEKGGNKKGTVNDPGKVKEGDTPTITWKADEGSHVKRVVIDGVVRDDLITANKYTFSDPFFENHSVRVDFEETTSDTPAPNPTNPDPSDPVVNNKIYQVTTSIEGCGDGSATITPTKRLNAGSDFTVTWDIPKGYWITKILVDNVEQNKESENVELKGIQSDHNVVVVVDKLPSMGGVATDDYYTITVNKYGGNADDGIRISPSQTIKEGEGNCRIEFNDRNSTNGYKIYKVMIDGQEFDHSKATSKSFNFNRTSSNTPSNHVVDVYIQKDEEGTPVFNEEEMVKVTTQVVGGPGTISGGAAINKGEDYEVSWTAGTNNDLAKDNPKYSYYEVDSIEVKRGETTEVVDKTDKGYNFTDLTEDATVTVKLKPVMHDVIVKTYGDVDVNKLSKTLWHLQSYTEIEGLAKEGSFMAFVVVDGQVVYTAPEKPATATTESQAETQSVENKASDNAATEAANNDAVVEQPAEESTETDNAVDASANVADEATETEQSEQEADASEDAVEALALDEIQMRDAEAANNETTYTQNGTDIHKVDVTALTQNHVIEYYALKNEAEMPKVPDDPDGKKDVLNDIKEKHYSDINVSIVDANGNPVAGTSISGIGGVENGSDRDVSWTVPTGYKVDSVTLNGQDITANGTHKFTNVQGDQNLVIKVSSTTPKSDPIPGDFRVDNYNVTTSLQGGFGEISGAGTYDENKPATVKWTPGDAGHPDYVVKYVFVDGKLDPTAMNDGQIKFTDNEDHSVVVVVEHKDKTPTNIDKDGDGKPDVNIDPDGDGKPDINVDPDGDGEPDVNIVDEDGDGKPDPVDPTDPKKPNVNVDTDDDGKPDVNKDTDGDGKPDINIVDEDGDGKPDPVDPTDPKKPNVNVDVTGDDKPDVNVDTDGDGDPDVNIVDKDGDGKPDPVDPTKPIIPDVNVVIDPETGEPIYNFDVPVTDPEDPKYWPTVNVDTDDDGKPDVNIDVDGDGTPDINIVDEDKNGKPDPIKPGTHPTPTINVDTNGDGIPDEGIDRNYGNAEFWQYVDNELAKQGADGVDKDSKDKKSKKSKSSKTGDMAAPIVGGIALIALLSGLVLVLARRRKEN